jgi:hypothetical protein
VGGAAVEADRLPALDPPAELGREHDAVAAPRERAPEQLLVRERPVDLGGVEEVHPELERPIERRERLRLVGLAVRLAHPHAAEPEARHLRARPPQPPPRERHRRSFRAGPPPF